MTKEQALDFIRRYPDARSYVKPSHLEELSPLLEVSIEAIECRKDEFHPLASNTYMPRKETVDRFALAAGISYNPLEEATRKEGDCYIGRSQAMIMGPDGKYIFGDICEYEFDVEVRHEEEILADRLAKFPRLHAGGKLVEDKARLSYLNLRKVARQRANTGARNRATLSILGMQTGFKDLFRQDTAQGASITFLFSRIIVNTKNEAVMGYMLRNITMPAAMLYGNQAGMNLPSPAPMLSAPAMEIMEIPDEEPASVEDGLEEHITETLARHIKEIITDERLGPKALAAAQDALEHHGHDEGYLADILSRLKAVQERIETQGAGARKQNA